MASFSYIQSSLCAEKETLRSDNFLIYTGTSPGWGEGKQPRDPAATERKAVFAAQRDGHASLFAGQGKESDFHEPHCLRQEGEN